RIFLLAVTRGHSGRKNQLCHSAQHAFFKNGTTPRRALRDRGVLESVCDMDAAYAAPMDGFTAVSKTPLSRSARPPLTPTVHEECRPAAGERYASALSRASERRVTVP